MLLLRVLLVAFGTLALLGVLRTLRRKHARQNAASQAPIGSLEADRQTLGRYATRGPTSPNRA